MKILFWIYLVLFLILTPLFIYDMYVNRKLNFTVIALFVLLFAFYGRAFKKEDADTDTNKEQS